VTDAEEDVDLDPDTRRYVLEVHATLDRVSHYELLGIPRDADKKAIKRAYFRLAATLHPDRYFGKKLGSFKPKLEILFKRISQAHDLLLSEKRKEYDATLGAATVVVEDPRAAAARREEEQKRAEAVLRAKPHVEAARRAEAAGDLTAAIGAYRAARAILPDDPELERAHQSAQRTFAERASEGLVRQAMLEEKHGHWDRAATTWKRALMARPHDENVRASLARVLARLRDSG
jgi:curved DNA-binding protein CbpA